MASGQYLKISNLDPPLDEDSRLRLKRARWARCFDWLEPFPNVEESDSVILDLRSLTQSVLTALANTGKLSELRSPLQTLIRTGRNVYCVIQPLVTEIPKLGESRSVKGGHATNYSWMPYKLQLSNKKERA